MVKQWHLCQTSFCFMWCEFAVQKIGLFSVEMQAWQIKTIMTIFSCKKTDVVMVAFSLKWSLSALQNVWFLLKWQIRSNIFYPWKTEEYSFFHAALLVWVSPAKSRIFWTFCCGNAILCKLEMFCYLPRKDWQHLSPHELFKYNNLWYV